MSPDNQYPFQTPASSSAAGRSRGLFGRIIRKVYIWLPVSLLLLAAAGYGVYVWRSNSSNLAVTGQPSSGKSVDQSVSGSDLDESDELLDDEGLDEKQDEKQEDKKTTTPKPTQKPATGTKPTAPKPTSPTSPTSPTPTQPPSNPPPPHPPPPPTGFVKPNASNTGPRYSITRTMTANEALAELRQTGYLSRVRITNTLRLSGSDGRNWIIEDSIIEATSTYGLQTYQSIGAFTGSYSERPIFRYVEIRGRAANNNGDCSAAYYGSNVVLENMDMYGCIDIVKATTNTTIKSSWLHDNDHPSGAHCDAIQIVSGTNIQIIGNRLDAYVGYSSDGSQSPPSGATCSGGLQTGSVINNISARFENNWFAGGHYTIRGWSSSTTYNVSYVFRNNKWMRNGTSAALGRTDLQPNRYGATTGNLGDFDSSNVWEDTGQPVR